jgi:hypothetical protein
VVLTAPAAGAVDVDPAQAGCVAGAVIAGPSGCEPGATAAGAVEKAKDPCRNEPKPDEPQAGLGAVLAPKPPGGSQDPYATNPPAPIYQRYGYGGYQLPVYDLGCLEGAAAGPGSFLANTGLRGMVWLTALGGFLNRVGHVHTYWDILDPAIAASEQLAQRLLWSQNGVLSAAIGALACVCVWLAWRRKVSVCLNLAATAFLVLALGHATAFKGVESAHWLRDKVTNVTDMFHNSAGDPNPTPASDVVQRELLDRTWAAAMFGDADKPAAKEYGPRLRDCLTWRWDEEQNTDNQARKMACVHQLMDEMAKKYPSASEYAHGAKTGQQAATTWLGLLGAFFVCGWEIFAGLAGLVLNAVCTFIVPAVAFVVPLALFKTGIKYLRALGELLVGSAIRAAVCAVTAQLVAAAEGAVLGAGSIPWILKLIFTGLIAWVAWKFTRRHRRLVNGAVHHRATQAAAAAAKAAAVGAGVAAAAYGLPLAMSDDFPKPGKKGKAGKGTPDLSGAVPPPAAAAATRAVPPPAKDGWVASDTVLARFGLPRAGETGGVTEVSDPIAMGYTMDTFRTRPAGELPRAPVSLAKDPDRYEALRQAANKKADAATTGDLDRYLTGMYVADGRGRPIIDVHGWVAPAPVSAPAALPPAPVRAPRPAPRPRGIPPMPGPTPPTGGPS